MLERVDHERHGHVSSRSTERVSLKFRAAGRSQRRARVSSRSTERVSLKSFSGLSADMGGPVSSRSTERVSLKCPATASSRPQTACLIPLYGAGIVEVVARHWRCLPAWPVSSRSTERVSLKCYGTPLRWRPTTRLIPLYGAGIVEVDHQIHRPWVTPSSHPALRSGYR